MNMLYGMHKASWANLDSQTILVDFVEDLSQMNVLRTNPTHLAHIACNIVHRCLINLTTLMIELIMIYDIVS